ncbi:NfeD family protein [Plasticicumulans acidivorans]|uniref:NfeD-like C-terminal domain-containing protein n=1 Tax=Plasticicumulans acidivorans TaxID=886464 RepID=A0A317MZF8_9GAMM|nr:NfeD family protein [Plasticicumulans acidivorans]PWV64672.1 hypothetical protein C7443_102324 [Plasticicumulans acidivorans]
MTEWLLEPAYWNWWLLGVVLMIVEVLAPGFFFLWLGVSAAIVGLLVAAFPGISADWQWLVFAVLAVAAIVGWRMWLKRNPTQSDAPTLNRRGEAYRGRVLTLVEPIVNGEGRVRIDDTLWKIRGDDAPAGARVRVCGVDGPVLRIEPVEPVQAAATQGSQSS